MGAPSHDEPKFVNIVKQSDYLGWRICQTFHYNMYAYSYKCCGVPTMVNEQHSLNNSYIFIIKQWLIKLYTNTQV